MIVYCFKSQDIFTVYHDSNRTVDPMLYFDNSAQNQPLLWLGLSGRPLGVMEPSAYVDFELSVYPIEVGMHCLPTIKITDSYLKIDYKFDEIAFVFVE